MSGGDCPEGTVLDGHPRRVRRGRFSMSGGDGSRWTSPMDMSKKNRPRWTRPRKEPSPMDMSKKNRPRWTRPRWTRGHLHYAHKCYLMDIINNFIGRRRDCPKKRWTRRNYGRSCWNQRRSFFNKCCIN